MTENKAVVVASIIATHELARDFNNKLSVLKDDRPVIVDTLVKEAKASYAKLTFEFEYRTISAKHEPFSQMAEDSDPIRVVRVWINKEAWLVVSLRNGVKVPPIPERTISCVYGRVNGVLVKGDNSGFDLLESNISVTDEQWLALKEGHTGGLLKRNNTKAAA